MLQLKEVTKHLYLLTLGEKPIAAVFIVNDKPIIIVGDVKPSVIVGDMNE
jgi:hypothetical protein